MFSTICATAILFLQGEPVHFEFGAPTNIKLSGLEVKIQGNTCHLISGGTVTVEKSEFRLFQEVATPEVPVGIYTKEYLRPRPVVEPRFSFHLGPFVTAKLDCSVLQYTKMSSKIHAALFDQKHRLLGTATAAEEIEYIRLGVIPTLFRTIEFDFGCSKLYDKATEIAFVVEESAIPNPPNTP